MRSAVTKCRQLERKFTAQQKAINAEFDKWRDSHTELELLRFRRGMLALVQKLGFAPVSPVPLSEMETKELMERLREFEDNFKAPGKYSDTERWRLRWALLDGWRRYQRGESI